MSFSKQLREMPVSGSESEILLGGWVDIVEAFVKAGADPRMNQNSQLGSCIREAFGFFMPLQSRRLEKILKAERKRWSLKGKFLVPPFKRDTPTFSETTPIAVLNWISSTEPPLVPWDKFYRGRVRRNRKSRRYPGRSRRCLLETLECIIDCKILDRRRLDAN